jgi:HlyD family secretion protein
MGISKILKWASVPALLLAAAGYWYFKCGHDSDTQYQTSAVVRGDLTQAVTATGQLNPVTNVTVGSQISGIIAKLYVDWNSLVKKDQVIAELDPAIYKASVAQAKGDLANSKANLELAQAESKRAAELSKDKLISDSDYDTAMATLHQAEATVQLKQAALDNAQVNLDHCTIYSPVDGIVISRNVDVGQTVAASLQAPTLFVIANDLAQMQIDANVAEADVGGVEEGQNVDFTVDAFPYRKFHGKVTQIRNSPVVVQNVVTYDTVISVRNDDLKLRPGMTANVSIIIAQLENVLKIPNAALRFRPPESDDAKKPATGLGTTNAPPQGSRLASGSPPRMGGMTNAGAGRSGGNWSGAGGGHSRTERQFVRPVYVLPKDAEARHDESSKLKAVQIKPGISDGVMTEVVEGLNEGDLVVTGAILPGVSTARPTNPFGGGVRRF